MNLRFVKTDSVYAFSISRKWLVIVGLKGADTTSFALRCPKANFSTLLSTTPFYRGIRPSRQDHTHERFSYSDTDSPMDIGLLMSIEGFYLI